MYLQEASCPCVASWPRIVLIASFFHSSKSYSNFVCGVVLCGLHMGLSAPMPEVDSLCIVVISTRPLRDHDSCPGHYLSRTRFGFAVVCYSLVEKIGRGTTRLVLLRGITAWLTSVLKIGSGIPSTTQK